MKYLNKNLNNEDQRLSVVLSVIFTIYYVRLNLMKIYANYEHGGLSTRGLKTFAVTLNQTWRYCAPYILRMRVCNVRLLPIGNCIAWRYNSTVPVKKTAARNSGGFMHKYSVILYTYLANSQSLHIRRKAYQINVCIRMCIFYNLGAFMKYD